MFHEKSSRKSLKINIFSKIIVYIRGEFRLVCYLFMKKYSDKQVCKQLNIAQKKLNLIKYKLALELRFAGIRY